MADNQPLHTHALLVEVDDQNRPLRQWSLNSPSVTIGRDDTSDITIENRQISRLHVRISADVNEADGKSSTIYSVQDLDSRNGTWLNGKRLHGSATLKDNDEIHLALVVRLQFIDADSTAPGLAAVPDMSRGRLYLDREARRVVINGTELDPPLSLPQYRLLELLYVNADSVCSRDAIVDTVWPETYGEGVSEQAIDALVRRLRDRLAELDADTAYINTVRGHGFRFINPS
jgi:hypothetical protein